MESERGRVGSDSSGSPPGGGGGAASSASSVAAGAEAEVEGAGVADAVEKPLATAGGAGVAAGGAGGGRAVEYEARPSAAWSARSRAEERVRDAEVAEAVAEEEGGEVEGGWREKTRTPPGPGGRSVAKGEGGGGGGFDEVDEVVEGGDALQRMKGASMDDRSGSSALSPVQLTSTAFSIFEALRRQRDAPPIPNPDLIPLPPLPALSPSLLYRPDRSLTPHLNPQPSRLSRPRPSRSSTSARHRTSRPRPARRPQSHSLFIDPLKLIPQRQTLQERVSPRQRAVSLPLLDHDGAVGLPCCETVFIRLERGFEAPTFARFRRVFRGGGGVSAGGGRSN